MTKTFFSNRIFGGGTIGTVWLEPGETDLPIPSEIAEYNKDDSLVVNYPWESNSIDALISPTAESTDKFNRLKMFAEHLLQETEDLDPAYGKIIDDNFWDLL